MTPEEKYKITSQDYADIIFKHDENPYLVARFENNSPHIMNVRYAVAYVPKTQITGRSISLYGYSAIPKCYGLLSEKSLEASGINKLRRTPSLNLRGQGVLVGIIDTGIDYTNPAFLNKDGTSRIAAIWDQTIDSEDQYPEATFYGTEFTKGQIDLALSSANPLEIVPSVDEIGHGTMLAGVAAGTEITEKNFSGVVPDSELVIVKLKQAKQYLRDFFSIPEGVPCYQENDIMWAMRYLSRVARRLERPISICLGLGTSQGSHDGRGFLDEVVSVTGRFPGVVVTIAAGNEGNSRRHYTGIIDPNIGYNTIELNVAEDEKGFAMEIWGNMPGTYSIDLTSPTGEYIARIGESLRVNREISFVFEKTIVYIDYRMVAGQTGDQLILLRLKNPTPGIWKINVYGRRKFDEEFHSWLPADDFISTDTYFLESNPFTTTTAPSNAQIPITVTAYNPINNSLYPNASNGYSLNNNIKPELAAPGVDILGPTIHNGFVIASGTSLAAAHTAGITAMLLEWGIVKRNYQNMSTVDAKSLLIKGARRDAYMPYPNKEWGYGRIDIYNTYNMLKY